MIERRRRLYRQRCIQSFLGREEKGGRGIQRSGSHVEPTMLSILASDRMISPQHRFLPATTVSSHGPVPRHDTIYRLLFLRVLDCDTQALDLLGPVKSIHCLSRDHTKSCLLADAYVSSMGGNTTDDRPNVWVIRLHYSIQSIRYHTVAQSGS